MTILHVYADSKLFDRSRWWKLYLNASSCRKWENLPAGFKQLKLDKMDGKNLMNKIELLMAALSNSQWFERSEP